MRTALLILLLLPFSMCAQDSERFQRALQARSTGALDRWMKHEIHRHRKGQLINTPNGSYNSYTPTYDSLVAFMRRQTGVEDAQWDRCIGKIDLWPGHSTIGLRWTKDDQAFERCWTVQEGIPGTIKLFGWRPRVRSTREHLRYKGARECAGFVAAQKEHCGEAGR